MESALVAGRGISGGLADEGPPPPWPLDDGQGRFEVRAHVKDAVYRYLQGWTPLTQAEAQVRIDGSTVHVTGEGRIGALAARDIVVDVARTEGEFGREARVEGRLEGPVAET